MTDRGESAGIVSLAVFSWAFPGVFVRLMPHLLAGSLVGLRLGAAFAVVAPVAFSPRFRAATMGALRSPACWWLGGSMLLYYLVATPAFYYAPVGEVALLIASAPLFAVLIRLVARLPVERSEIAGAALAVLGVGIMAYPSLQQARLGSQHWIGVALSLTAAVCAAAYAIGNRQLHASGRSPGAVPQALLTFCLGLVLLPFLFWEPAVHLRSASLAWVVPLGVFSTAVPTVLVAAAAHRISSVVATLINPMTAVGANVVAAIALGEVPSPSTLAGGVLVIAAIWIAMRPRLASSPKQVQTSEVPQRGDIKPPPARD